MMMGNLVIAVYKPRAGKEAELLELLRVHLPVLRREGLATDRPPLVLRAQNGALLEIFEWTSAEATERAHTSEAVLALWGRFEAACEYSRLADLAEAQEMFAHFQPLDL
jgi:hypothetical protein